MSQHDIEWNQTKQEWICREIMMAALKVGVREFKERLPVS
jgi:hypothetical protein